MSVDTPLGINLLPIGMLSSGITLHIHSLTWVNGALLMVASHQPYSATQGGEELPMSTHTTLHAHTK